MKEAAYQLIVAIANQGYTDTVMGALAAQEPTAAPFCTPRAPAPRMPRKFFGDVHCRGAGDHPHGGAYRRQRTP